MHLRTLVLSATLLASFPGFSPCFAQGGMQGMQMAPESGKAMPSPPATATVSLGGQTLTIKYNAPHLRGRHVGGPEIVPYGQVWRTGANPATTLITPVSLHIGSLLVPAGTYTLFTLPTAKDWMLIVSTKTGEWGIPYPEGSDLGRAAMKKKEIASPQEVMSISFDDIKKESAELHIRWDTTDAYVKITTP